MDQIATALDTLIDDENTVLPVEVITYQPLNGETLVTRALVNRGNITEAMRFGSEYDEVKARILIRDPLVLLAYKGRGDRITAADGVWLVDEVMQELPEAAGVIFSAVRRVRSDART
ncbi:MAG: hypothetical protein WC372_09905 [Candidatus Neomarinimicrobiota bacterium]|jgi:hypothetical protein